MFDNNRECRRFLLQGFRLQAGYWGYRNLERSPVPSEATVTYELRLDDGSVETVAIPWRARARRDFTGASIGLQGSCDRICC